MHADQKSGAARFPNGRTGIDAASADVKEMLPRSLVAIAAGLNASHLGPGRLIDEHSHPLLRGPSTCLYRRVFPPARAGQGGSARCHPRTNACSRGANPDCSHGAARPHSFRYSACSVCRLDGCQPIDGFRLGQRFRRRLQCLHEPRSRPRIPTATR